MFVTYLSSYRNKNNTKPCNKKKQNKNKNTKHKKRTQIEKCKKDFTTTNLEKNEHALKYDFNNKKKLLPFLYLLGVIILLPDILEQ